MIVLNSIALNIAAAAFVLLVAVVVPVILVVGWAYSGAIGVCRKANPWGYPRHHPLVVVTVGLWILGALIGMGFTVSTQARLPLEHHRLQQEFGIVTNEMQSTAAALAKIKAERAVLLKELALLERVTTLVPWWYWGPDSDNQLVLPGEPRPPGYFKEP
jgi:hypothetical protein